MAKVRIEMAWKENGRIVRVVYDRDADDSIVEQERDEWKERYYRLHDAHQIIKDEHGTFVDIFGPLDVVLRKKNRDKWGD